MRLRLISILTTALVVGAQILPTLAHEQPGIGLAPCPVATHHVCPVATHHVWTGEHNSWSHYQTNLNTNNAGTHGHWQPYHSNGNNQVQALFHNINYNSGINTAWTTSHETRVWSNVLGAHGLNLDLSSTTPIGTARHLLGSLPSVTISVNGNPLIVTADTKLTAAEYLTVKEVISGQQQSLELNSDGTAYGGTIIIGQGITRSISSLVIPQGVTVIDLTKIGLLNVHGSIIDDGTLDIASANPTLPAVHLISDDITVGAQGSISDILGASNNNLTLNIMALGDLSNAGSISSSGALNVTALGNLLNTGSMTSAGNLGIVAPQLTNSGQIVSTAGSINIVPVLPTAGLTVNATGGTLSAATGNINIGSSNNPLAGNINLNGGNWMSNQLNVNGGTQGNININVNQISGTVNEAGYNGTTTVATGQLNMGNMTFVNDPTFYNDGSGVGNNGDIVIGGNISVGEDLSIVAAGDITANGNYTISASNASQGFDINLVAGANISTTGTVSQTVGPGSGTSSSFSGTGSPATNTVTISGASSSGGNIDFSGESITISSAAQAGCSNCNGGNVRLMAFTSGGGNGGEVLLSSGTSILTGGTGSGTNGNVTIFAENQSNNSTVTTGLINTTGGSGGGGNVTIQQGTIGFKNGTSLVFNTDGSIAGGNDFTVSGNPQGSLTLGNTLTAAGQVTLAAENVYASPAYLGNLITNDAEQPAQVNAAGTLIYFADGSNLDIFNASNFALQTQIPISGANAALISPSGQYVYVVNERAASSTISVVSTATNQVVASTPVNTTIESDSLALSPNGNSLYFVGAHSGAASIYEYNVSNPLSPTFVKSVSDNNAQFLAVSTNSQTLFVGGSSTNVLALNASTLAQTNSYAISYGFVDGLAVDPTGRFVVVASGDDTASENGSVQSIYLPTGTVNTVASVSGTFIGGLGLNPQGNIAFFTTESGGTAQLQTVPILLSNTAPVAATSVTLPSAFSSGVSAFYAGNQVYVFNSAGDYLELPQITAPTATLTGGASVTAFTNVQNLTINPNNVGASSSATIAQLGSVNLTNSSSRALAFSLGTYALGSSGANITSTGTLDITESLRLFTVSNNSTIAINGTLEQFSFTNTPQVVDIINTGTGGGITQSASGALNFSSFAVSLLSDTGNIGSSSAPLNVTANSLLVATAGSVWLGNISVSGPLTVGAGGSLNLSSSITFNSASATEVVLAAGQDLITTSSILTNSTAAATELLMVAGVSNGLASDGITLDLTGGSNTGGSIQVDGSISTNGGNFVAAAYNGGGVSAFTPGSINITGSINTGYAGSSTSAGTNGNVTIIAGAPSGVSIETGDITTSSAAANGSTGGSVVLLPATPVINSPGTIAMNVTFTPDPPFALSGQSVVLTNAGITVGNVITSGAGGTSGNGGGGGSITIQAVGSINTNALEAYGGGGAGTSGTGGSGGQGGAITVVSSGGLISIDGVVNSSGGGGGSGATAGGAGGDAGAITISAPTVQTSPTNSVTVAGPILASGGGNGGVTSGGPLSSAGGGSFGGAGGSEAGVAGSSTEGDGTGGILGNPVGSPLGSGNGGVISLLGPSFVVNGTVGSSSNGWAGFSSSPFAGDSVDAYGTNGQIIGSFATVSPVYLQDANYGSGANTYPITITSGSLTTTGNLNAPSIVFGGASQGSSLSANTFTSAGFSILEGTQSVGISDNSDVTPAEYVAVVQLSTTGIQTLTLSQPSSTTSPGTGYASGSSFSIGSANIPAGNFSNLVLPSGVTMNVDSHVPTLTYTGTGTLNGTVNFASTTGQLSFGSDLSIGGSVNFNGGGVGTISSGGSVTITAATPITGSSASPLVIQASQDIDLDSSLTLSATTAATTYIFSAGRDIIGSTAMTSISAPGSTIDLQLLAQRNISFASTTGISLAAPAIGTTTALVAGQDLTLAGGGISLTGAASGANLVLMAGTAGSLVSGSGISVSGNSTTGGAVVIPGAISTLGDNVAVVAYFGVPAGSTNAPGTVTITGGINTGAGTSTDSNGNVAVLAGATSGTGISIGDVQTTSGTFGTGNSGSIFLGDVTPVFNGSSTYSIASGIGSLNPIFPSSGLTSVNGSINAGNLITVGFGGNPGSAGGCGGSVSVQAGGSVTINSIKTYGGGGGGGVASTSNGGSGGSGGSVSIVSANGCVGVTQEINTAGGGGGGANGAGGAGGSVLISAAGAVTLGSVSRGSILSAGGGNGGYSSGGSSFGGGGGGAGEKGCGVGCSGGGGGGYAPGGGGGANSGGTPGQGGYGGGLTAGAGGCGPGGNGSAGCSGTGGNGGNGGYGGLAFGSSVGAGAAGAISISGRSVTINGTANTVIASASSQIAGDSISNAGVVPLSSVSVPGLAITATTTINISGNITTSASDGATPSAIILAAGQDLLIGGGINIVTTPQAAGNLILLAGVAFTGNSAALPNTLAGASATGGSVQVDGAITTNGDNLVAAAYTGSGAGSSWVPGSIEMYHDINTGGTNANGSVTLIAGSTASTGILTENIIATSNSNGVNAGSVFLATAQPVANGTISLTTTNATPNPLFATTGLTMNSNATINVLGYINTSGFGGAGGTTTNSGNGGNGGNANSITIEAGGNVSTGALRAFGGGGGGGAANGTTIDQNGGNGGDGAAVSVSSSTGNITISGEINTSGGGGGGGGSFVGTSPGTGGSAGPVSLNAAQSVSISGPILAAGGGNGSSACAGGSGGSSFGGGGGGAGGYASSASCGPGLAGLAGGYGGAGYTGGGGGGGGGGGSGDYETVDGFGVVTDHGHVPGCVGSGGSGGGPLIGGNGGSSGSGGVATQLTYGSGGGGGGGGGGGNGFGGQGGGGGKAGSNSYSASPFSFAGGTDGCGGRGGCGGGGGQNGSTGTAGSTAHGNFSGSGGVGGGAGGGIGSGAGSSGCGAYIGTGIGAGSGAAVKISAQTVTINGTVSSFATGLQSTAASALSNDSINAQGVSGTITVNTAISNLTYFADANYGSGASTYPAPLGGFTTVGQLEAGQTGLPIGPQSITINGLTMTSPVAAGSYGALPSESINESGNNYTVTVNTPITPAEWIAYIEVESGIGQTLVLQGTGLGTGQATSSINGSSFTVAAANIPAGNFTNLVLPSGVTEIVQVSQLTYTGTAQVNGTLQFTSSSGQLSVGSTLGVSGALAFSSTGQGSVIAGGTISGAGTVYAPSGLLSLSSTGGNIGAAGSPLAVSALGLKQLSLTLSAPTNASGVGNIYITDSDNDISAAQPALSIASATAGSGTPVDATTGNLQIRTTNGGIVFDGPISASTSISVEAKKDIDQSGNNVISTKSLTVYSVNGNVGTSAVPLLVAGPMSLTARAATAGESVAIQGTGALTLVNGTAIDTTSISNTANSLYQVATSGQTTVDGNISAPGTGGRVNLWSSGGVTISPAASITGTNVEFAALTPGSGSVSVTNNGTVTADIIGFNGGASGTVTLNGSGSLFPSNYAGFGNLDNNTLAVFNPVTETTPAFSVGLVTVSQSGIVGGSSQVTFVPPVVPSTAGVASSVTAIGGTGTGIGFPTIILPDTSLADIALTTKGQIDRGLLSGVIQILNNEFSSLPLQGGVSMSTLLGPGEAVFNASSFNAAEILALSHAGIQTGTSTKLNFLDLLKGFVLFMPDNDITVRTREGDVLIPKGAVVWIMETGADAAIYDFHDRQFANVKVAVNGKTLLLAPGVEMLLTRNLKADFDTLNPGKTIAYNRIRVGDLGRGIRAYICDFSIPYGMANVDVIRKLLTSNDPKDRAVVKTLMKNAAILATIKGNDYWLSK